jgi:hypothetical protein
LGVLVIPAIFPFQLGILHRKNDMLSKVDRYSYPHLFELYQLLRDDLAQLLVKNGHQRPLKCGFLLSRKCFHFSKKLYVVQIHSRQPDYFTTTFPEFTDLLNIPSDIFGWNICDRLEAKIITPTDGNIADKNFFCFPSSTSGNVESAAIPFVVRKLNIFHPKGV